MTFYQAMQMLQDQSEWLLWCRELQVGQVIKLFWFLVLVSLRNLSVLCSSSIGTVKSYQPAS